MARMLRCRDLEMECDFVAQADTDAEVMRQVADHARTAHGMKHLSPEIASRARGAIQEAVAASPPRA